MENNIKRDKKGYNTKGKRENIPIVQQGAGSSEYQRVIPTAGENRPTRTAETFPVDGRVLNSEGVRG